MNGWEGAIQRECETLKDFLTRKNQNYGGAVFENPSLCRGIPALMALLVRMSDKTARIAALTNGEKDKVGESIEDTVRDLAGYCVLFLALKNSEKSGRFPE